MDQNGFKLSSSSSPYGLQKQENGRNDVSAGPKLSNGHSFAENLIAAADSQHSSDSEELEALDVKINPVYSSQSPSPGRTSASESPEAGTSPGSDYYKPHEVSGGDQERYKSKVSNPREFYQDSYSPPRDYFKSKESASFDYFRRENTSPEFGNKMDPDKSRTDNFKNEASRNPFLGQTSEDIYRRESATKDYYQDKYGFRGGSGNLKSSENSGLFSSDANSLTAIEINPFRLHQQVNLITLQIYRYIF